MNPQTNISFLLGIRLVDCQINVMNGSNKMVIHGHGVNNGGAFKNFVSGIGNVAKQECGGKGKINFTVFQHLNDLLPKV